MTPEQTQRLEEFAAKLSEHQEAAIGVGIYAGRGELELLRREITRLSTIQGELLEACGRDRIIIQTPTPLAPSDALDELRARVSRFVQDNYQGSERTNSPRTYTAEQAERAFWVGWSGMSVADFRRALEEEDGK